MNTNETLTRRWFAEGWGQQKPEVFRELSPHSGMLTATLATGPIQDLDEFLAFFEELTHGIPDMQLVVEQILPTEEGTVTRWRFTGTHTGEAFGMPASGRRVEAVGTTWQTLRDGRVVGGQDHWDFGSFCASLAG